MIQPVETDNIITYSRYDFEKCSSLNYTYIDSVLEVNVRHYIDNVKPCMSHLNYVHCGIAILSMSKRVVNKVFDVCTDCGGNIYYQDTDSIHLNYDDVDEHVNI